MKKKSIAILYGGKSGEHEVSIISASSVISHLNRELYEIIPIGINKSGHWFRNDLDEVDPVLSKTLQVQGPKARHFSLDDWLKSEPEIDVIFSIIHGNYGEDGCLQGYLELTGLPYVGPNVLSSSMCMDKDVTKRLIQQAGLATAPYCVIKSGDWLNNLDCVFEKIKSLHYPLFVKPANTGSSVGISKAKTKESLLIAIKEAFQYDTKIIIEQGLNVREVELAVLENSEYGQSPLVSVPGEIITTHEFYDYEAKYLDEKGLTLTIPALVSEAQLSQLQDLAKKIFVLMECEGMARADFFINKDTGQIIFNELNTIPGFTHVSMYPMMWQASGLDYSDLLTKLIDLAIARQVRKDKLKRDFC